MPGDTGPVTMTTNNQTIEAQIQAKGKTAPRITPDDIDANIASTFYFTAAEGVRGESAVVFIENNVPQTGREFARKNAVDQIWQLLGYELRSKLANKMECTCGPNEGCSSCPPRGIA